MKTLQSLINDKLDELRATIGLRGAGETDEALKILLSGGGKQIMDRIRGVIHATRTEELSMLDRRNRERADAARRLILMMSGGAAVLLILLLAGAHEINSDITERKRMEEELCKSELARGNALCLLDEKWLFCRPLGCTVSGCAGHPLQGHDNIGARSVPMSVLRVGWSRPVRELTNNVSGLRYAEEAPGHERRDESADCLPPL